MNRVEREKKAYDEDGLWDYAHRWHMRFEHVFHTPNTLRHEAFLEDFIREKSRGKSTLEIGCGPGETASKVLAGGAARVFGVDVSEKFLAEAKLKEIPGRMEFALADVHEPMEGSYDLVFGRAILHHIDYKAVLTRLYRENLNPGGSMIFLEPLGENLLLRLYYVAVPKAHTPDERPFFRSDLRWLRENFPGFRMVPSNYLSLPAGIVSSLILSGPDNILTRAADRADGWIAKNIGPLTPRFRNAAMIIEKPAG